MSEVTRILDAIDAGEPSASDRLLPLVYDELRRLAARRLAQEAPGQTLQATALVHEAYLRLVKGERPATWNGRGHFFGAAAEAMRRILVERARGRRRVRHGGGRRRVDLDEACPVSRPPAADLLALDEALTRLAGRAPARAELVKLRFFAGLTMPEAAEALGISLATAERYWTFARAWLYAELIADETPPGGEKSRSGWGFSAVSSHGMPEHLPREPAQVWEIDPARPVVIVSDPGGVVGPVAFSPDGKRLAGGVGPFIGSLTEVKAWDTATGRDLLSVKGEKEIVDVIFSPDGRRLATLSHGEGDGKQGKFYAVKLWDAATGLFLARLPPAAVRQGRLQFTPDGARLLLVYPCPTLPDGSGWREVWDATPLPDPPPG
jgi:RNA polymerase sigma factor (TIGR02999 family)